MAAVVSSAKFHENFWGQENSGYEVLLQNMKAGITASKELAEFVKERGVVEDTYIKGLSKLQKSVNHIPDASLGTFGPLWSVLKVMCEKLISIHTQFVKILSELAKEITDYNHTQKEKMKSNMRGEIEQAQEMLATYQATGSMVERSKKHYLQSVGDVIKIRVKLEKAKVEAVTIPKAKQRVTEYESRMTQVHAWMSSLKLEHQSIMKKHFSQLSEFKEKMSTACIKFESLEEEHMTQMATFMMKIAQGQDANLEDLLEVYSTLNSKLGEQTVEKLLEEFVAQKGTGKDEPTIPSPRKSKADSEVPIMPASNIVQSHSTEDISVSGRSSSKSEKKAAFRPFKKKTKNAPSNGPVESPIPETAPKVDAEGYSIRPEDAANVSKFSDNSWLKKDNSDSDSDFDDEPENKIRALRIRESSAQPAATLDDIKASVMSMKLGSVSPSGIRKATSSQSLNLIGGAALSRKMTSINNPNSMEDDKSEQQAKPSLIDLDTLFSDQGGSQMPTPLKPSAPNSKLPHITPPLLTSPPLNIRAALSNPLVPMSATVSGGGPLLATTLFNSKPVDPSASLPPMSFISSPSTTANNAASSSGSTVPPPIAGIDKIVSPTSASDSPVLARPRSSSIKSQDTSTSKDDSRLNSIPAPPMSTNKRSAGVSQGHAGTKNVNLPITDIPSQLSIPLHPAMLLNGQDATRVYFGSQSQGSSPILGTRELHTSNNPSQLNFTDISSSSSSLREVSPTPVPQEQPTQNTSHSTNLLSPLATSHITIADPISNKSLAANPEPVPLAIVVKESCDAIFKGVELEACAMRVTGEVSMSFLASFLPQLASCEPLTFRVHQNKLAVERLLHNQHLLKKAEGDSVYTFDMTALDAYLSNMKDKEANKPFYNIQVLKYDVKMGGGGVKLPLQLKCYIKCDTSVTNFRADYTYHPNVFSSTRQPTLTKLAFSLPMDGGVHNVISKPTGKWSAENNCWTWVIGTVPLVENPVAQQLHAKFSLKSGPSHPTTMSATFECEGVTFSGLSIDLQGTVFKVFLKEGCRAGKYTAEPKV